MFGNKEPMFGLHYEIRYSVFTRLKGPQQYRTFITKATSYSDAIRQFLLWANNGEEKFDENRWGLDPKKKVPIKFEDNPVTENCIDSIVKWHY